MNAQRHLRDYRKTRKGAVASLHIFQKLSMNPIYNLIASLTGFANFVAMVNSRKGAEFQEQI